jgi:hypothetical protein
VPIDTLDASHNAATVQDYSATVGREVTQSRATVPDLS